jgi:methyltransferase (TIGR00027 family)
LVARSRAAHQVLDEPKLLHDPIALRIIGARAAEGLRPDAPEFSSRSARYLRAFVVARSRFAEDELARAVQRGIRQYVVLGAGLDTFAYRNPHPGLRVFEIDHPNTQAWKRERLRAANIALPESLTFVPVDFETQTLAHELQRAGFDDRQPAFFSWLGVTMYLNRETVMATARYIATTTRPGTELVFDYTIPLSHMRLLPRIRYRLMLWRLARVGEPFKSLFDPAALTGELKALGFSQVQDVGPRELNRSYFTGAGALRVAGAGRLMLARV